MKYVVLVKGVPDFRHGHVKFKEDNTLDRGGTPTVLNPNDHLALQGALEAKVKHGGEVHLISMGPPNYKKIIAEATERLEAVVPVDDGAGVHVRDDGVVHDAGAPEVVEHLEDALFHEVLVRAEPWRRDEAHALHGRAMQEPRS